MSDTEWMDLKIEIQVGTVIMHAWAEVEHDIIYKSFGSEPPSDGLKRVSDLINGIAITGELALRQLRATYDEDHPSDVSQDEKQRIRDHKELGARLDQYTAAYNLPAENLPAISKWRGLKELFEVLKLCEMHDCGSIVDLVKSASRNLGEEVFDELIGLHLLLHFAQQQPKHEHTYGPKIETTILKMSQAISILQAGAYLGCGNLLRLEQKADSTINIIDVLEILHPRSSPSQVIANDFALNLEAAFVNPRKELQLRCLISIELGNSGCSAQASNFLMEQDQKDIALFPIIPGTTLNSFHEGFGIIGDDVAGIASVLHSKRPSSGMLSSIDSNSPFQKHSSVSLRHLGPAAFVPRVDDGKFGWRWSCLYGTLDWSIQNARAGLNDQPTETESHHDNDEESTATVCEWISRTLSSGQQVSKRKITDSVRYRNRLYPYLSSADEEQLWIGKEGINMELGYHGLFLKRSRPYYADSKVVQRFESYFAVPKATN